MAYKGYTGNLNLNSVKQSQSMFARRVYELMASNTLVTSNFARGLRNVFGDLALCTDSADELERRRAAVSALANGEERLKAAALRKVMREHTYSERLAFIAEQAGITLPDAPVERPLLLAQVDDTTQAEHVSTVALAQSHTDLRCAIVQEDGTGTDTPDPRLRFFPTLDDALTWAAQEACTHLAVIDPESWYGREYIGDLLLALRWADVPAAGLLEHWAFVKGRVVKRNPGECWSVTDRLARSRSVIRIDDWAAAELRDHANVGPMFPGDGLATGSLGYCFRGAGLEPAVLEPVSELTLRSGLGLEGMREWARSLPDREESSGEDDLDLQELLGAIEPGELARVEIDEDGAATVISELPNGMHRYLYTEGGIPVDQLLPTHEFFYLESSPGLDLTGALVYLDATGQRLGHTMLSIGRNTPLKVPDGTTHVRFGLRIAGPGRAEIKRAVPHEVYTAPPPVITRGENLLVSNIYPAYDNLYRNGFVHSRIRAYAAAGHDFDVMTIDGRELPLSFREFQNVDVTVGTGEALDLTLSQGRVRNLFVHALNPGMWAAIKAHPEVPAVRIWVHGAEVQPWFRRPSAYPTPEALEQAKAASAERMTFWRSVLSDLPGNVHFVFVSQYLADVVLEDVGVSLPRSRYSIIPNPIDNVTFRYREKAPELRRRVLSIRPYPNKVYANDLSVKAVLELAGRPGFEDLHFTFCGDGPLFDETLAPLQDLPNVEIRKGFLTHTQIAHLHAEHGVFLVPTRMDTQGVSRDEAMSSGLVPVTSAVAAVPEFVDDGCAVLAPEEDFLALADGVWRLAEDPDLFVRMSAAAAERARQSASDVVIPRELALRHHG